VINTALVVNHVGIPRQILAAILSKTFKVSQIADGLLALDFIQKNAPKIILLNFRLLKLSLEELLMELKNQDFLKKTTTIVTSQKNLSQKHIETLYELGIDLFLNTSDSTPALILRAIQRELDYKNNILTLIKQREASRDIQDELVSSLIRATDIFDPTTKSHAIRVSRFAFALATAHGLNKHQCEIIHKTAPMHDCGKIGLLRTILNKPGKLTNEEYEIVKIHSFAGATIIGTSQYLLQKIAHEIALSHHERWDGKGYPKGLKGQEIPLTGRITAIADVFDALVSERPYKKAMPFTKAVNTINTNFGTQFDPNLKSSFNKAMPAFKDILTDRI